MPDQIRSNKSLVVSEPNQLNVLIKAVWTLKFEVPIENGGIYAGSPYIADLINRAYDSLIGIYDDLGDSGSARAWSHGESWQARRSSQGC